MIQHSYVCTTTAQTLTCYSQTSTQAGAAMHNTFFHEKPQYKTKPLTEITDNGFSVQTLLSTLATLTQQAAFQHGWLLLIAPPWQLTKSMLEQAGIQSRRILLIPQRQISRFDNLMRDALTCTTCSAVVSFLAADQTELEDYRYLSAKYGTPLLNMTTDLPAQKAVAH